MNNNEKEVIRKDLIEILIENKNLCFCLKDGVEISHSGDSYKIEEPNSDILKYYTQNGLKEYLSRTGVLSAVQLYLKIGWVWYKISPTSFKYHYKK